MGLFLCLSLVPNFWGAVLSYKERGMSAEQAKNANAFFDKLLREYIEKLKGGGTLTAPPEH